LVLLLLDRCARGSNDPTPTSALEGSQWALISLNGDSLIEGTTITLTFADGYVNGLAGCNAYRPLSTGSDAGQFRYKATEEGKLIIPAFAITEKDCPTPVGVMQQEQAYIEALRGAAFFRMLDDRLEIDDAGGVTTLVFTRQD
jgi:heat shock protein HslJ